MTSSTVVLRMLLLTWPDSLSTVSGVYPLCGNSTAQCSSQYTHTNSGCECWLAHVQHMRWHNSTVSPTRTQAHTHTQRGSQHSSSQPLLHCCSTQPTCRKWQRGVGMRDAMSPTRSLFM